MNEPFSIIPKTNMIKKNCTLIIFFRPLFIFCAASQPWLHWHGWFGWSGWLDLLPVCCPAWVAGVPVGVGGWRDWSPNCLPSRWALKKYSLIILSIFFPTTVLPTMYDTSETIVRNCLVLEYYKFYLSLSNHLLSR